jgi:hypothetical protein
MNIWTRYYPLSYWHEYLDMVLLFKLTNNMIYTQRALLPTVKEPGRSTRSSSRADGAIMLEEQLCRTSTYARFRSKRVWNVLPEDISRNTTSLSSYKHFLKEYYQNALKSTYDFEDARGHGNQLVLSVALSVVFCAVFNVCMYVLMLLMSVYV